MYAISRILRDMNNRTERPGQMHTRVSCQEGVVVYQYNYSGLGAGEGKEHTVTHTVKLSDAKELTEESLRDQVVGALSKKLRGLKETS